MQFASRVLGPPRRHAHPVGLPWPQCGKVSHLFIAQIYAPFDSKLRSGGEQILHNNNTNDVSDEYSAYLRRTSENYSNYDINDIARRENYPIVIITIYYYYTSFSCCHNIDYTERWILRRLSSGSEGPVRML